MHDTAVVADEQGAARHERHALADGGRANGHYGGGRDRALQFRRELAVGRATENQDPRAVFRLHRVRDGGEIVLVPRAGLVRGERMEADDFLPGPHAVAREEIRGEGAVRVIEPQFQMVVGDRQAVGAKHVEEVLHFVAVVLIRHFGREERAAVFGVEADALRRAGQSREHRTRERALQHIGLVEAPPPQGADETEFPRE